MMTNIFCGAVMGVGLACGLGACDDAADAGNGGDAASDTSAGDAGDTGGGVDVAPEVGGAPKVYLFDGRAEGQVGDRRVECVVGGRVDQVVADGEGGFTGWIGGEVFRNMFPDTRRFEFQALIGGPVALVKTGAAAWEWRPAGEQPDDAKPFWRALEALAATSDGAGGWRGEWECAPIDIDFGGFLDDGPTVKGTWTMKPEGAVVEPIVITP